MALFYSAESGEPKEHIFWSGLCCISFWKDAKQVSNIKDCKMLSEDKLRFGLTRSEEPARTSLSSLKSESKGREGSAAELGRALPDLGRLT